MTCQECRDLLSALIDHELSVEELEKVRAHLQKCVQCSQECAELCCLDAATGQACCSCLEVPVNLWERVQDMIATCCAPGMQAVTLQPMQTEVLTCEETASYLRVSIDKLLALLDVLPHFRIGEHIRFRRRALEQWMETQEQIRMQTNHLEDNEK